MSIISDALKKAQQKEYNREKITAKTSRQTVFGLRTDFRLPAKNRTGKTKTSFLITGLLFIVTLVFFMPFISAYVQNFKKLYVNSALSETISQIKNEKIVIPLPQTVIIPVKKRFTLNGIVYDEKNPLAIINDRIVKPGSLVDDATVMEISTDSVKLNHKGEDLILYLSN